MFRPPSNTGKPGTSRRRPARSAATTRGEVAARGDGPSVTTRRRVAGDGPAFRSCRHVDGDVARRRRRRRSVGGVGTTGQVPPGGRDGGDGPRVGGASRGARLLLWLSSCGSVQVSSFPVSLCYLLPPVIFRCRRLYLELFRAALGAAASAAPWSSSWAGDATLCCPQPPSPAPPLLPAVDNITSRGRHHRGKNAPFTRDGATAADALPQ